MGIVASFSFTGAGGDPLHTLRVSLSRERTTYNRYALIRQFIGWGWVTAKEAKGLRAEVHAAEVERKRLLARGRRGRIRR